MTSEDLHLPLPRIRAALREQVAFRSERAVAREVGISPRGLRIFLEGSRPQVRTKQHLLQWYRSYTRTAEVDRRATEEALEILIAGFPPTAQYEARRELLAFLDALYTRLDSGSRGRRSGKLES
jgi:FMN phosphatase YigB (HAD superfamily)